MQTVPLLVCLMFFSLLVGLVGLGEGEHRGKVPFSSHPIRVRALNMTPHCGWALGHVVEVSLGHLAEVCLSGDTAGKFLFLPIPLVEIGRAHV